MRIVKANSISTLESYRRNGGKRDRMKVMWGKKMKGAIHFSGNGYVVRHLLLAGIHEELGDAPKEG